MSGERERPPSRHGLGDPRIPWVVLLDADLDGPTPSIQALSGGLGAMAVEAGWASPGATAVSGSSDLAALAVDSPEVLRVSVGPHRLVLAARHDALDGLGMLTALGRLLGSPVRSAARGVDPAQRSSPGSAALVRRAWEVIVRPQATAAASRASAREGDVFAVTVVPGSPRTADLVHAGARAVAAWNRSHAVRSRRVSVSIGLSTVGGSSQDLADHSGFVRLREVDRLSLQQVRDELAGAPLEAGGGNASYRPSVAAAAGVAQRLAASRLGSTLLVSHLGRIEGPDALRGLAFYPVTGGGSGLSLGAATVQGRTTLTMRARAQRYDDEGLQRLLALVVEMLG